MVEDAAAAGKAAKAVVFASRGVAAHGAVVQRKRAGIEHTATGVGGVAADAAVGQRQRAGVVHAAAAAIVAVAGGIAAGHRQTRDRRGDQRIDLEHPARVVAADRHARRRAGDRGRARRVTQLELGAGQGDRLRRVEHSAVKDNHLVAPSRIRLDDRLAQVDLASNGRVGGVVYDDRGRNPAVLQRLQGRAEAVWHLANRASDPQISRPNLCSIWPISVAIE